MLFIESYRRRCRKVSQMFSLLSYEKLKCDQVAASGEKIALCLLYAYYSICWHTVLLAITLRRITKLSGCLYSAIVQALFPQHLCMFCDGMLHTSNNHIYNSNLHRYFMSLRYLKQKILSNSHLRFCPTLNSPNSH